MDLDDVTATGQSFGCGKEVETVEDFSELLTYRDQTFEEWRRYNQRKVQEVQENFYSKF